MTSCLVWQSGNFDSGSLSTEKDIGNFSKNLLNEAPNITTLVKELYKTMLQKFTTASL